MKRGVKVLHCLETIGSGGVEQRRLLLAKNLDKNVFDQQLVCSYILNDFDKKFEAEGVSVRAIGGLHNLFNIRYYARLFMVIIKFRPHIIHGAVFEGVISAALGGLLFRVPIIIIEETSDPQNRSWRGNLLMKFFSRCAHYVVGISPAVVAYLRNTVQVKESKVRLINNGIGAPQYPEERLLQSVKDSMGIKSSDFVLGSVGRLRDFHKRFSDLIKAVALLREDIPNLKLIIVGDGEDRLLLTSLATDLKVEDRVIFAGYQKDTGKYYACMNIFTLASHMEGFGLVLIEAMFFRLPVIVTAVGGMKDIVLPGETGLLVEKDSPRAFATAIRSLHSDEIRRKEMGERGYNRAQQKYSAEAYVAEVEKFYFEACRNKNII